MIGEGLYECGSCGHCWDPEVIEDLDSSVELPRFDGHLMMGR
jgi:hypothetical protein